MDQVDEDRHQNNWVGEESCHSAEDRLAEDMADGVGLACAVRHTEELGFVAEVVCCGACMCLDDRIGRQPVAARKVRLASRQVRLQLDHHYAWHKLKLLGRQSAL